MTHIMLIMLVFLIDEPPNKIMKTKKKHKIHLLNLSIIYQNRLLNVNCGMKIYDVPSRAENCSSDFKTFIHNLIINKYFLIWNILKFH